MGGNKKRKLITPKAALADFGLDKLNPKKKTNKKAKKERAVWDDVNWRTDVAFAEWLLNNCHIQTQHTLWVKLLHDYDGIPEEEMPPNAHRSENVWRQVKMLSVPKKKGALRDQALQGRTNLTKEGKLKPGQSILSAVFDHHKQKKEEKDEKERKAKTEKAMLRKENESDTPQVPADDDAEAPEAPKPVRAAPAHKQHAQKARQFSNQADTQTGNYMDVNPYAMLEDDEVFFEDKLGRTRKDMLADQKAQIDKIPLDGVESAGTSTRNRRFGGNSKVVKAVHVFQDTPSFDVNESKVNRAKSAKQRSKLRAQRRKGSSHK